MYLERYEYKQGLPANQFYFYSDGPKGRIRKIVYFNFFGKINGYAYYNLGFGDYDPKTNKINDRSISDNGDRDKILATIAAIALDFIDHLRNCRLIVSGTTPARTRLYQMKINAFYDDISELFDIQGRAETGWEKYQKGKNYSRFQFEKFKFEVWEE
jgi:hypothetical protein